MAQSLRVPTRADLLAMGARGETLRFSPAYVRGICEALRSLGHDPQKFLAHAKLDPTWLFSTTDWFSAEAVDDLTKQAVATAADPALGLHWGELSPLMQFDLGPSLVASAPTLRDAIDAMLQLQLVFVNREQYGFREEEKRCVLALDLRMPSELVTQVLSELWVVSLYRGFCYLGHRHAVRQVDVAYPAPPHGREYARILGCEVRFDQPRTAIELENTELERTAGTYSEPLHRLIREHTRDVRRRVLQQLNVSEQLCGLIRNALPRVLPIEEAAQTMGVSGRSLRRRLADEQVSFTDLVDGVQRERALDLVEGGKLSVKEIAHEVGFGSTGGFQRAYRRWTGGSPGQARGTRTRS